MIQCCRSPPLEKVMVFVPIQGCGSISSAQEKVMVSASPPPCGKVVVILRRPPVLWWSLPLLPAPLWYDGSSTGRTHDARARMHARRTTH